MAQAVGEVGGEACGEGGDGEDGDHPRLGGAGGEGGVEQGDDGGREEVDGVGGGAGADVDDYHKPDLPVGKTALQGSAVERVHAADSDLVGDARFDQLAVFGGEESGGLGPVGHDEVAGDGYYGGNRAFDDEDPGDNILVNGAKRELSTASTYHRHPR